MVAIVGPVCAGVALVAGRLLGAQLGTVPGIVVVAVTAVALWFALARRIDDGTGLGAAVVWMLVGALNAHVGDSVALLASGEHVVGAHVSEIAAWRDHARVTFGDGELRVDLEELAGHTVKRADGYRGTRFDFCIAKPIVPDGWRTSDPIRVWSLDDRYTSQRFAEQSFEVVATPDPDCQRAIDAAVAKHHLVRDTDPVFLERLETQIDPDMLRLSGLICAIAAAVVWLAVVGWRKLRG